MTDMSDAILDAARLHVPFDGWSQVTFEASAHDAGVSIADARALFPRGAVDLAMAFHRRADRALAEALAGADLGAMRFRDRVTFAVKRRLELVAADKETVRRGATLFALPIHAADGAKLMWETADVIWTGLGDSSRDLNWYTKRATLAGVYSATVLFWLGDQSEDHEASWDFLDRRIGDVMKIEEIKAKVRGSALMKPFAAGLDRFAAAVRAPRGAEQDDLPGRWTPPA